MTTTPERGLADAVARHGGRRDVTDGRERWWITDPDPAAAATADRLGLTDVRRLHQMRRPLPLDPPLPHPPTRAFDPERDVDAWLEINNAAFSWHPEQGNWTRADLEARMQEPWFDLDGFRVADDDGSMVGFCWTKVHPAGSTDAVAIGHRGTEGEAADPEVAEAIGHRGTEGEAAPDAVGSEPDPEVAEAIGEIYVIAVAPSRIGTGLGTGLTVAGLDWLWTERRTPVAMLYVESDNDRALATYRRLGFTVHSTDVAYTAPAS